MIRPFAADTVLVEDIAPDPANAVGEVVTMGGELWFGVGGALYRSNGTAAGRVLVPDTGASRLNGLRAGDGVLSFSTDEGSFVPTRRLWRSDGATTEQSPMPMTLRAGFVQVGNPPAGASVGGIFAGNSSAIAGNPL